mgnify:CR=1 FL=1
MVVAPATMTQTSLKGNMYSYNKCFDKEHDNVEVYNESCDEIVMSALNGINGTIFMYGQTGAGKTYTMLGDAAHDIRDKVNLSKIQ